MNKKAAILFTGFARCYKETYNLFFNRFVDCNPHWDIDIYLNFQPYVCRKNSTKKIPLDLEHLKKTFNADYFNIYEVDEKEIEKKYLNIKDMNLLVGHKKNVNFIKGSIISQYYGWNEAINNLDKKKYDLIFKMRTDILPIGSVNFDLIDSNIITHFKRADHSFGIDDFVFCSNQKNMRKIMKIYDYLSMHNLQDIKNCFPEYILEKYCKELNIKAKNGPKLTKIYR